MPVVRIDLIDGKPEDYWSQVGEMSTSPWSKFSTFPRVIAFK
jgi:hypothetical protein